MPETKIYNLDSDSAILEDLSNGMMNREIEQKFIYQGIGANFYYEDKSTNPMYMGETIEYMDFVNMWKKEIEDKSKKTALISLGCGNSGAEKYLYENIDMDDVSYYGIDASEAMLELTANNFKEINCKKRLICSDFTTRKLRFELHQFTKNYNKRVFAFFSNTFGNIQHTKIIDILYNLLNSGDAIWLDVRLRRGLTVKDDLDIVNTVSKDLHRKETNTSYTRTLLDLGVKPGNGELKMKSYQEPSVKALKCIFNYEVKNKSHVSIKGDEITLLPGESIKLLQIYIYHPDGLIDFFKEHGFKLIEKQVKGYRGQFLFEKK